MDEITESIIWLLGEFKNGEKDFSETVVEIKRIYARKLGLVLYEDFELAVKDEIKRSKKMADT